MQHVTVPEDKPMLDANDPLWCEARCNRCNHTARYEVTWATIHPNAEQCEAEAWDGIVLGRIIVCEGCGAEDDYTLAPPTKLALIMKAVAVQDEQGRRGKECAT